MRDLIGDLGEAVRAEGMKYGISYHRERHPSRFTADFVVNDEPFPQVAEEIKMVPEAADLYGPFDYSDEFIADYVARWKEAEEKYRPDFMWLDDVLHEFVARRLDENPARRQDPVAVGMVDNRSSGDYAVAVFGDPEDPNWGWTITGHHPALDEGMRRRPGVASRE